MDLLSKLNILNNELKILKIQEKIYKNEDSAKYKAVIKEKEKEKKELIKEIHVYQDNVGKEIENELILGDCMDILPTLKSNYIDLCLSDIPYGINLDEWDVLHNNTNSALLGSSPSQKDKSAFKKRGKPINGWNENDRYINKEYEDWCNIWAQSLYFAMKEGGSVFIFGARRTIHSALVALEDAGFLVKDILAWKKPSAHHRSQDIYKVLVRRGTYKLTDEAINNLKGIIDDKEYINSLLKLKDIQFLSSKSFIATLKEINIKVTEKFLYDLLYFSLNDEETKMLVDKWKGWKLGNLAPIYEPIAWLFKPYSTPSLTDNLLLNGVGAMNIEACKINGKNPSNVLEFGLSNEELKNKLHECQKPEALLEFLIELTTQEGQVVLDHFMGSGSTIVSAYNKNRKYIGIEKNKDIYTTAVNRFEENKLKSKKNK